MPKYSVLDNVAHARLKVKTQFSESFGSNVNQAMVFPTEFQMLQREYPIFFRQSDDKKFYAVVLLGLAKDENLFLDADFWDARYIPAVHMSGPFALGLGSSESGTAEEPVVRVNLEDDRVSEEKGENIFLPHGGYSSYFEDMLKTLQRVYKGAQIERDFYACLESFELIEPVTVQASLGEDLQYTIPDLFTISQAKMSSLSAEDLLKLNSLGMLEHCFAIMSSAGNMAHLINQKVHRSGVAA
jgi:hypothetical protein